MISFLYILFLVAPILITGSVALLIRVNQGKLRLLLAFSAAYLFALSIIHLLPEAFEFGQVKQMGLFIVLGFTIQLIIDTFSTGIEHGHVHLHSTECNSHLPMGIVIGLFMHSFLEGLPVYNINPSQASGINHQLVIGLAMHNIPISLAFAGLLKEHEAKAGKRWALLIAFSLMSPLGYFFSYILQNYGLKQYEYFGHIAFAVVIGIFLHISTAILFESSEHHKYNRSKILFMAGGILLAYLIS